MKKLAYAAAIAAAASSVCANEIEDFRNSWTYRALTHQRTLDLGEPLGRANFPYTHNSYNSSAYANLGSYWDPNHIYSLVDQLDMGIRALELDVHYTYGDLKLCHGANDHTGCSAFDRRFEDGLKEVATWLRQDGNRGEVLIIYLEEHVDGRYDDAVAALNRQMGDLIYKPGSCATLPMNISKADILNSGRQVLLIGGNCGSDAWAQTVYNYGFPTDNDHFHPYPECRTDKYDLNFVQNNLVRIFEDSTRLSDVFGDPPQPITPELMAQAARCSLGVVGLDQLKAFDERMTAAVWSWDQNEPNNANNNEHCAEQWGNGRFNDAACTNARPFACYSKTHDAWAVTQSNAIWEQGEFFCQQEFGGDYRFATPKNGYQNQLLQNAKAEQGYANVWLNYSDLAQEGVWAPGDQPAVTLPGDDGAVVWRKLRNDKGKCLDLEGRETHNGVEIHQWSCHGADSQLWWKDQYGMIHAKSAPDKCIDVSGADTEKGARIVLWNCHGGPNQVWLQGPSNSFRISNATNMALDIKDPFWGDGQRAHLWEYHGGKSQRWSWD
ncbi:protein containing QXW lectin repeats [Hahella chejuensis KCTC 2396]|uniref:Protein containing QXW lectin repeats n=1 Tax=Hahella chejuensis (strain KCTC 2396) TaxID=349521 RepID=Q2SQH9_HAHCH|nr:ricin-type beta-trefoil lectin domain protein [Hahella chejuensis]ABC27095.1 protein containing QXW lectin repeats [Hahella chejuensis KCTC 2396]